MKNLREKIDYLMDIENPWIQAVQEAAEDVCDLEAYMGKWGDEYPKIELPDGCILTFRAHNLKVRLVREDPLTLDYKPWVEVKLKQRFECIPYIGNLIDKIVEQTKLRGLTK